MIIEEDYKQQCGVLLRNILTPLFNRQDFEYEKKVPSYFYTLVEKKNYEWKVIRNIFLMPTE